MKGKQAVPWKKNPDSRKAKSSGLWLWMANYTVSLDQCLASLYLRPEIISHRACPKYIEVRAETCFQQSLLWCSKDRSGYLLRGNLPPVPFQ